MTADEALKAAVSGLLGRAVTAVEPVHAGGNNRVFRVTDDRGAVFLAKQYLSPSMDGRNRMETEYGALSLLRGHGFANVPAPVARAGTGDLALYEFIEGAPAAGTVTDTDLNRILLFLIRLARLGRELPESAAPRAAEACFSLRELEGNIRGRAETLLALGGDGGPAREMRDFVNRRALPALGDAAAWAESRLAARGLSVEQAIPRHERVLSPSDFGPHNALRTAEGALAFVDFEYFGWDDPAKTLSDFLLHPATPLSAAQKQRVSKVFLEGLPEWELAPERFPAAHPLFAVKWGMILLNGFIPAHAEKRRALGKPCGPEFLAEQLEKAEHMLRTAAAWMKEQRFIDD